MVGDTKCEINELCVGVVHLVQMHITYLTSYQIPAQLNTPMSLSCRWCFIDISLFTHLAFSSKHQCALVQPQKATSIAANSVYSLVHLFMSVLLSTIHFCEGVITFCCE